jgi:hypothetical protein
MWYMLLRIQLVFSAPRKDRQRNKKDVEKVWPSTLHVCSLLNGLPSQHLMIVGIGFGGAGGRVCMGLMIAAHMCSETVSGLQFVQALCGS